jgi:cytoskeletal protein RodZ
MQIDSALSSTLLGPDRATTKSPSALDDAVVQTSATDTSMQDDAVHISAEGAATAARDGNTGQDGAASDSASEGAPASGVSAVKSFAYGTLGLERPDQPQEERNAFYTAGRWLAAGITLGGIISLLA